MTEFTSKQLQERYRSLPEDLKDAIFSEDVTEHILSVGKEYHLSVDQTGELADETGLVFLGITRPETYISNIARRLGIERNLAAKIGGAINERIFRPVRESLKKVHGIGEDGIAQESAVAEQEVAFRKPPQGGMAPAFRAPQEHIAPPMAPPAPAMPPSASRAAPSQQQITTTQALEKTPEEMPRLPAPSGAAPAPFIPQKTGELVYAAPSRSAAAPPSATSGEKKEKERVFEQLLKERENAPAAPRYGERDPYREPAEEIKNEKSAP